MFLGKKNAQPHCDAKSDVRGRIEDVNGKVYIVNSIVYHDRLYSFFGVRVLACSHASVSVYALCQEMRVCDGVCVCAGGGGEGGACSLTLRDKYPLSYRPRITGIH